MKRGEIAANTPWSESTVSRTLKRLETTGDVTRYRLGRENLVYLWGNEPAAIGSPFAGEEDAPLTH